MKSKTIHDVRGYNVMCPNYQSCPLCYGCRNYNSSFAECDECAENKKINICKVDIHKPDLIAKMIAKTVIKV